MFAVLLDNRKNESMNNRKKGINLMCALGNGFD